MSNDAKAQILRAENCRREAIALMEMVEKAHSIEARETYLSVATRWLQLADEIEKTEQARTPHLVRA